MKKKGEKYSYFDNIIAQKLKNPSVGSYNINVKFIKKKNLLIKN